MNATFDIAINISDAIVRSNVIILLNSIISNHTIIIFIFYV